MVSAAETEIAKKLPPEVLFGTSSWNYPGWQGQIYTKTYKSDAAFKAESLEEYAQYPWFRTVGLDASFYGPPSPKTLARMSEQLPGDFPVVSKVWEDLTVYEFPAHKRYGKKAGSLNPRFLDPAVFTDMVLPPYRSAKFEKHMGPFVFQFGALPDTVIEKRDVLLGQMDSFLAALPKDFRYAFEVRNPELLQADYFSMLNANGATHCFNHWTGMPPIRNQMESSAAAGGLTAPFYVCRILTPRGVSYEQAVRRFSPYSKLVAPIPEMRHDAILLGKRAVKRKVPAFILVNNRVEGNAPQTISAIGTGIVEMIEDAGKA